MMRTRITELLGIDRPVLSGGMMWISRAELVVAVGEAGGMGFMTALSHATTDDLAKEIRKIKAMTDKPFGVNLTILPTLLPVDYGAYVTTICEEGVKFVETAGRNPEPYMEQFKAAGIKVIHKCTSVRHAIKAEKVGCDAVSIDGFEAAGHPGEDDVTSLILVPCTADAISIPFVASGGFGDARGLAAALALGADGMNMGTRFLVTQEAPVHDNLKQALVNADERQTRLLLRTLKNTERVYHNSVADKVLEVEAEPGETHIMQLAPIIGGGKGKEMLEDGDIDKGVLAAGQVIGLIHDIPTVQELMDTLMSEAREIISGRLAGMI